MRIPRPFTAYVLISRIPHQRDSLCSLFYSAVAILNAVDDLASTYKYLKIFISIPCTPYLLPMYSQLLLTFSKKTHRIISQKLTFAQQENLSTQQIMVNCHQCGSKFYHFLLPVIDSKDATKLL